MNVNDGCSEFCQLEKDYVCVGEPSICTKCPNGWKVGTTVCNDQVCGNAKKEGAESCDDGNQVAADGCSAVCGSESGYICIPSDVNNLASRSLCVFASDARISKATPLSGPFAGQFPLMISGSNLNSIVCLFAGVTSVTAAQQGSVFTCLAPPAPVASSPSVVTLNFLTGDTHQPIVSEIALSYTYFEPPSVKSVLPSWTYTSGGGNITVSGIGFLDHSHFPAGAIRNVIILRKQTSNTVKFRPLVSEDIVLTDSELVNDSLVATLPLHFPAIFEVVVSPNYFDTGATSMIIASNAQVEYKICDRGLISSGIDQPCLPCPRGTYQNASGQSECIRCPENGYASENGTTVCQTCPPGTSTITHASLPTSLTQCICAKGFFHSNGEAGVACDICPSGGICAGGDALPLPLPGYWLDQQGGEIIPCSRLDHNACPGGYYNTCGPEYVGIRCGECNKGYYRTGATCTRCPNNQGSRLVVYAVVIIVFSFVAVYFARERNRSTFLTTFSIASNFFQILGIVLSMGNMAYIPILIFTHFCLRTHRFKMASRDFESCNQSHRKIFLGPGSTRDGMQSQR